MASLNFGCKPMLSSLNLHNRYAISRSGTRPMPSPISAHSNNSQLVRFMSRVSSEPSKSALPLSKFQGLKVAPCSAVKGDIDHGASVWPEQAAPFTELTTTESSESNTAREVLHRKYPKQHKLLALASLARIKNSYGAFITGPWLLILLPVYWGIALAAKNGSGPVLGMLALFAVAEFFFYCAICTINDLWDIDFDSQVERTTMRPLASGALTPLEGWTFFGGLTLSYVAVMLQLENFSKLQGLGAIYMAINFVYPLMKRWTYWPQAWLGMALHWSVFLGWTAVRGTEGLVSMVLPLFLAGCCWTIVYDTIYAHQDMKWDIKVGIKSTAIAFGKDTKLWLTGFSTACIAGLCFGGFNAGLGWPYFVSVAAAAGHLAWQLSSVDLENPADCKDKFISNIWIGAMLFGGIICGRLLA